MAVFTRINGDAAGVLNVDAGRSFANGAVINTGIAAPITFTKVTLTNGNLAAELTTGGAVESIIRAVEQNATVLAYQVDSTPQISIITERSGWASDAAIQAFIISSAYVATGNVNYYANVTASNVYLGPAQVTVSSSNGFKLA